jgi:hypothetical protein
MLVYTVGRSYLFELLHAEMQAKQVRLVKGREGDRAYTQLAELEAEPRETGIVYRCAPGKHDDLAISCAMVAWAARHPHLDHWTQPIINAHRPRPKLGQGQSEMSRSAWRAHS